MGQIEWVAGVYLERQKASVLVAPVITENLSSLLVFERGDFESFKWGKIKNIDDLIYDLGTFIRNNPHWSEISRLGVACYGPFLSLDKDNDLYGRLHAEHADLPFRGAGLRDAFLSTLRGMGMGNVEVSVLHDGNACALGEAVARNLPRDKALAYVLVTEGIGLGFVVGQTIPRHGFHPEIGPLTVRIDPLDILADTLLPNKNKLNRYTGSSLARLADNKSLRERAAFIDRTIRDFKDERLGESFEARAYYLAQGCVALTALLAPSRIVIGCDIDPDSNCVEMVQEYFQSFRRSRKAEKQPLREYADMGDSRAYIVEPTWPGERFTATIGATGAVGACAYVARGNPIRLVFRGERR